MTIDKLDATTPDLTRQNIARLAELFPECVTEGPAGSASDRSEPVIDFDLLRQALADHLVEGPQERYRLDWPGKRQALLAANAPIDKTLRPMRDDSVDFDTTRNLFIEGDNLDALKLLQETYLGQVKMIYIDPPYNTGGDFIYNDSFALSASEYDTEAGQRDAESGRLVSNPETNGRFHSDWLSMMYPRIKLARNLLSGDGVLFASIADDESANLKHLLDEVFGSSNFIDTIVVEMSTTSGPKTVNAQQGTIVKNVEFVHVYRKSDAFDRIRHQPLFDGVSAFDTHYSYYMNTDGTITSLSSVMSDDNVVGAEIERYKLGGRAGFNVNRMDQLLAVSEPAKSFVEANLDRIARVDRAPVSASGQSTEVGRWEAFDVDHRTYYLTTLANGTLQALMPLALNFRQSDDYKPRFGRSVIRGDLWKGFHQDMGNVAKEGETAFANGKKPVRLIKQLMKWANNTRDGTVMDFFAGSATTAQAVFEQNAEDGQNRNFILVQLDEIPEPKSEAAKAGYSTISQLSRERIRRARASVLSESSSQAQLDVGFRAFRIDSGNLREVRVAPDQATQATLDGLISHIKDDRTDEDLLFGALLRWGVDVTLPVRRDELLGRTIWIVDPPTEGEASAALIACFARGANGQGGIDTELADALAALKPLRVLFRDDGFVSDAAKENVASRFKQRAPDTAVRVL
jgi:adenine-specific DNA-methyltransferase